MSLIVIVGLLIVVATFVLIILNYETRLVLALSGAVMALIGGGYAAVSGTESAFFEQMVSGSLSGLSLAVDAFIKQFVNGGLVPTICTVLGFSYVMNYTKCSDHLVALMSSVLKFVPIIILPGSVIITFLLNIALPSAAGVAAAVGALLIPMLLAMKVKPGMAASAVYLGTWGSVISPGLMFNPQIADMAKVDVMSVIATTTPSVLISLGVAAALLTLLAIVLKEGVGSNKEVLASDEQEQSIKVNYLHALVPVLPLILLVVSSKEVGLIPYMSVPQAMLLGTVIGFVVTRCNPGEGTKKFFRGAGDGFADVVGLMAAAAMFGAGMDAIGLTGELVEVMKNSKAMAKFAAAAGPFAMAAVSGSGNAAALAFNNAVVPQASIIGYGTVELGSVAQIAAALGRTMSPVAAAAIICAKLAGVNPMEIAKRNAIPTIGATIAVTLLLL